MVGPTCGKFSLPILLYIHFFLLSLLTIHDLCGVVSVGQKYKKITAIYEEAGTNASSYAVYAPN